MAVLSTLDEAQLAATGLTSAQVTERVELGLTNQQKMDSSRSFASILRANLFTLFNAVVGGAFLILLALGQWKDALFGFAVVTNISIGIIQEFIAKRALDRLALLHQPNARVRRNGESVQIETHQIVLDDLLELRAGDQILADAVIVEQRDVDIDESLLTGESEPVQKRVGDEVLAGSGVLEGSATARVIRVGADTYASKITLEARRFSLVSSELRNSLARIIKWISWALVPMMLIAINGQVQAVGGWGSALQDGRWLEATVASIASIVGMVPQGLVLITSIAFAVAALKLSRQKVLVQELPAVEGLARVDTICFDKTGTLTQGDIRFDAMKELAASSNFRDWREVLGFFGAQADANATTLCLRGHFTAPNSLTAVGSVPFSSSRKFSSFTFAASSGQGFETFTLGAPEMVLDAKTHADALAAAGELANMGRRTLVLTASAGAADQDLPTSRVALALVTFREQVRLDAAETLGYFKAQGVTVKVISGDNPNTVAAVAREAGLEFQGTGFDARNLPENLTELANILEVESVFGRVTPEQKRNMVAAMQSRGHVIAMTGDGVNDALALKKADLGIAMGSAAAATKAVSNLVLLDSKFSSLPGVVSEGRRVIANIERVSRLFLTKVVWAMTLTLVFGIFLWAYPILPRQISAMDVFTIGLPSFALALLPNSRRYLPGFLKRALYFCVPGGLIVGGSVIALDVWLRSAGYSVEEERTSTAILMSIAGLWVLCALARPFTRASLSIVVAMYALMVGTFAVPAIGNFFGFTQLDPAQWFAPVLLGVLVCAGLETVNRLVAARAVTVGTAQPN
jgi:cation-transporting ATPase E